jgi:hypothetical protein
VTGSGAGDTIIDGGGFPLLRGPEVTIPNASTNVTLSNVALQNGSAVRGAGVYNNGTLSINNSIISENLAMGYSYLGCPACDLTGLGGGIYNNGTLTIKRSTIWGNHAIAHAQAAGGGIYNRGTLTINASTLSENGVHGPFAVGGRVYCWGGGVANLGRLVVNNSTITGNHLNGSCEGGGIYSSGILLIHSSTVSGNLGGIDGAATLQNSIVANSGSVGNCNGPMTSIFSLSSDGTCHLNGPGDKNNTKPRLGTLGNYGGPTQTIPLLSGSPAIDAGNPRGCTDPRVVYSRPIGAPIRVRTRRTR